MKNRPIYQYNQNYYYSSLFAFLWIILIYVATNNSMFWSGDSVEFLCMMEQIKKGSFPSSDLWLPFYPLCVGLISKITDLDFFGSARLFSIGTSTTIVFFYNQYFVVNKSKNWKDLLFLNIPIFSYSFIIESFSFIMAELCFFGLTMAVIYNVIMFNTNNLKSNLYWAYFYAVLSILTKLNGFANVIFITVFLIIKFRLNAIPKIILFWCVTILVYGIWLFYKPGSDFLTSSIILNDFDLINSLNIQAFDLSKALIKYMLPYRLSKEVISLLNPDFRFVHVIFYFICTVVVGFYVLREILNNKIKNDLLILIFAILFITLTVFRQVFSNIFEINQRTVFYAFFLFTVFIAAKVMNKKRLKILVSLFGVIGFIATLNTVKSMNEKGDIYLNQKSKFSDDSELILKFRGLRNNETLIFSNEHKILTVKNYYTRVSELPESRIFMGNFYKEDSLNFENEKNKFFNQIDSKPFVIVFYFLSKDHPRFDQKQLVFVNQLKQMGRNKFYENKDGLIIWGNIKNTF